MHSWADSLISPQGIVEQGIHLRGDLKIFKGKTTSPNNKTLGTWAGKGGVRAGPALPGGTLAWNMTLILLKHALQTGTQTCPSQEAGKYKGSGVFGMSCTEPDLPWGAIRQGASS